MAAYKKKTWKQKLHTEALPHVEILDKKYGGMDPGQKMLVPTPVIVNEYMRTIPVGKEKDIATIRKVLAKKYDADGTCPLTTGIFIRIAAEAAHEEFIATNNINGITPFWRVIQPGSPTAKKLSFGEDFLIQQRQLEGLQ